LRCHSVNRMLSFTCFCLIFPFLFFSINRFLTGHLVLMTIRQLGFYDVKARPRTENDRLRRQRVA